MVSNKKIDRALRGPGLVEITLGVLLSISLGVLLAALHLVFKPVETVTKPPESPVPGQVYLVEGAVNGSKSRQWMRKRQMLAEGGSVDVSFNEEELNAWIGTATAQPAAQADAKVSGLVAPERVNFRILDGTLQIALLGKLNALGFSHPLIFQTQGTFKKEETFVFTPKQLYVGSLPLHSVPGLAPFVVKRVLAFQELPEDLQTTWKQLKLVAIEGNTLRVALP